ncbi:BnaA09g02950D [Brassica napus]|uniref:BnaA09g02950D protein n=2 Tax=Brassica TaxID=3705 RepID=A0A078G3M6_BRANA|nr:BnaA09g02950D [Brassica napus]VDC58469.1 unnamed protein product [Brassica rapa]
MERFGIQNPILVSLLVLFLSFDSLLQTALSDFYDINNNYKTRVSLSVRNSRGEPLLALASAVDLLQSEEVEAIIIGGDSILETKLLAEIGEKARVPVISINSPISSSLSRYSHLIQVTHDSSSEAKGITAFIHGFDWNSVGLVYEDEDDWRDSMQQLVDHFYENGVGIQSKAGFAVSSTQEMVMDRLGKMKDLGTSVHFNKLEETIIWPGGSAQTPGGRVLGESKRRKLRVLVTSSNRFPRLMKVETDSATNVTTAEGFCIEVFRAAISPFDYELEFIPWRNGSNYNRLAYALYSQKDKYDAAVGDITITANRSMYVDFTMPFTEMGLGTVAPKETNMWVFFHPLTRDLWITSAAFFVLTGFIVWLIEKPKNKDFQGSWSKQIGIIFWFGFSTLVYAHREKLQHNLSRFVVTVWVFAVLILTASYTATLTSMMTVQQIQFNSNEDSVGHLSGSLIAKMALTSPRFRPTNTKGLNTSIEYAQALLNNSVSFIVDELPYLKVLLVEHPGKFLMVKAQCNTNGFGFMFQKGHELVPLVSKGILNLRTSDKLIDMEKRWFENQLPYTADDTLNPITLFRFRGLFMITGVSFAFALLVLLILWLRDTWEDLMSSVNIFLSQRLVNFRILFARTIHPNPLADAAIGENAVQMAQRNNR